MQIVKFYLSLTNSDAFPTFVNLFEIERDSTISYSAVLHSSNIFSIDLTFECFSFSAYNLFILGVTTPP
jgi:hypothetical protein